MRPRHYGEAATLRNLVLSLALRAVFKEDGPLIETRRVLSLLYSLNAEGCLLGKVHPFRERLYPPECVEGEFSEDRIDGVLGNWRRIHQEFIAAC
jgi:hypothetical protein